MGLYTINCSKCNKEFQWFSGNTKNQMCEDCTTKKPKLEAAAKDFTHKVGLRFLARPQYNVAVDSFKAGAEFALREAIEEINEKIERHAYDCQESKKYGTNSSGFNQDLGAFDASKDIKKLLEQLLSKDE